MQIQSFVWCVCDIICFTFEDKLDHHDGQALTHTQLVLKELVTTERDYVKDLASIMEVYDIIYLHTYVKLALMCLC